MRRNYTKSSLDSKARLKSTRFQFVKGCLEKNDLTQKLKFFRAKMWLELIMFVSTLKNVSGEKKVLMRHVPVFLSGM